VQPHSPCTLQLHPVHNLGLVSPQSPFRSRGGPPSTIIFRLCRSELTSESSVPRRRKPITARSQTAVADNAFPLWCGRQLRLTFAQRLQHHFCSLSLGWGRSNNCDHLALSVLSSNTTLASQCMILEGGRRSMPGLFCVLRSASSWSPVVRSKRRSVYLE
jgi:hypothetical protein